MMVLTVIESPYAGDVEANIEYAKRCVHDCLRRGEAPYASHLFFTQPGMLDDTVPEQRSLGIEAGLAWGRAANVVAVYVDRGISAGMKQGIRAAAWRGAHIEVRALDRRVSREDLKTVYDAAAPEGLSLAESRMCRSWVSWDNEETKRELAPWFDPTPDPTPDPSSDPSPDPAP